MENLTLFLRKLYRSKFCGTLTELWLHELPVVTLHVCWLTKSLRHMTSLKSIDLAFSLSNFRNHNFGIAMRTLFEEVICPDVFLSGTKPAHLEPFLSQTFEKANSTTIKKLSVSNVSGRISLLRIFAAMSKNCSVSELSIRQGTAVLETSFTVAEGSYLVRLSNVGPLVPQLRTAFA